MIQSRPRRRRWGQGARSRVRKTHKLSSWFNRNYAVFAAVGTIATVAVACANVYLIYRNNYLKQSIDSLNENQRLHDEASRLRLEATATRQKLTALKSESRRLTGVIDRKTTLIARLSAAKQSLVVQHSRLVKIQRGLSRNLLNQLVSVDLELASPRLYFNFLPPRYDSVYDDGDAAFRSPYRGLADVTYYFYSSSKPSKYRAGTCSLGPMTIQGKRQFLDSVVTAYDTTLARQVSYSLDVRKSELYRTICHALNESTHKWAPSVRPNPWVVQRMKGPAPTHYAPAYYAIEVARGDFMLVFHPSRIRNVSWEHFSIQMYWLSLLRRIELPHSEMFQVPNRVYASAMGSASFLNYMKAVRGDMARIGWPAFGGQFQTLNETWRNYIADHPMRFSHRWDMLLAQQSKAGSPILPRLTLTQIKRRPSILTSGVTDVFLLHTKCLAEAFAREYGYVRKGVLDDYSDCKAVNAGRRPPDTGLEGTVEPLLH